LIAKYKFFKNIWQIFHLYQFYSRNIWFRFFLKNFIYLTKTLSFNTIFRKDIVFWTLLSKLDYLHFYSNSCQTKFFTKIFNNIIKTLYFDLKMNKEIILVLKIASIKWIYSFINFYFFRLKLVRFQHLFRKYFEKILTKVENCFIIWNHVSGSCEAKRRQKDKRRRIMMLVLVGKYCLSPQVIIN